MVFWKERILEAIDNKLGKFVVLLKEWETKIDRRCLIILVELDMREGLNEELVIVLHSRIWSQRMDYSKLPFRCYNCRRVGHLQEDYLVHKNIPRNKKVWVKNNAIITRTDTIVRDTIAEGGEGMT